MLHGQHYNFFQPGGRNISAGGVSHRLVCTVAHSPEGDTFTDTWEIIMAAHRTRSFQEEYLKMLADHEVEYDPKYLWE